MEWNAGRLRRPRRRLYKMTYTLYSNGVLEKDGFYLPVDELNQDYQDYLAWLALGNSPTPADGSVYLAKLADEKNLRDQVRTEYQIMIARLEQIQNAGAIPFTQAGFNQVVQAVKDEALYIERIMKVIKHIVT
jgi:hypothetical protein